MSLINVGSRNPVTVPTTSHVSEVVRLREARKVGSVIAMDGTKPVDVLTDRDLVLHVMATGLSPAKIRVDSVMSSNLECVSARRPPPAAAVHMRERGVRRLPIVGKSGELVGIVTHDDLVHYIGPSTGELGASIAMPPAPRREG